VGSHPWEATHYESAVKSAQDYYAFGMVMPGRSSVMSGSEYRYGFNGKEKNEDRDGEEEIGNLTTYDYGFRIYNPGIGRFLSVDPLAPDYPWFSPYHFAGNTPIWAKDLDGLEAEFRNDGSIYYKVKPKQGFSQISQDLAADGVNIPWDKLRDQNAKFSSHITENKDDIKNRQYYNLNMNTGDYLFVGYYDNYETAEMLENYQSPAFSLSVGGVDGSVGGGVAAAGGNVYGTSRIPANLRYWEGNDRLTIVGFGQTNIIGVSADVNVTLGQLNVAASDNPSLISILSQPSVTYAGQGISPIGIGGKYTRVEAVNGEYKMNLGSVSFGAPGGSGSTTFSELGVGIISPVNGLKSLKDSLRRSAEILKNYPGDSYFTKWQQGAKAREQEQNTSTDDSIDDDSGG